MRIRLIGQRNSTGIGTHYACFADQLRKMHGIGNLVEEIDYRDNEVFYRALNDSQPTDINICFVAIDIHRGFKGTNIQWIVFETDRIVEQLLPCMRAADQVWVPSAWGREVLIKNDIPEQNIRVVPEGVNSNQFHAYGRKPWIPDRRFKFLTVAKYEKRKGIDETIEAFAQVYGNRPDMELVIKSNYFTDDERKLQELQSKINSVGIENYSYYWGNLDDNSLADLYRSCDAFILPTRGEGWGLPIIEAAAAGLPIITTMHSGHTEFLSSIKSSVVELDYQIVPLDCEEYRSYYENSDDNWGTWALPNTADIAEKLVWVFDNKETLYAEAQKNSEIIRTQYNWAQSVAKALQNLQI